MTVDVVDRFAAARAVADAVLYEGYVLYPYRASSRKNQVRWQFGVLTPRAFSEAEGSERWSARTECLLRPGTAPLLSVRVRCLQVQRRSVEAVPPAAGGGRDAEGPDFVPVEALEVDGQRHVVWDEAIDRVVDLPPLEPASLATGGHVEEFELAGGDDVELLHGSGGALAGRLVRRRQPVRGRVRVAADWPDGGRHLTRITVTVENVGEWEGAVGRRDDVLGCSLVAVHTMLAVDGGTFVSLLDPPATAREAVAGCRQDGTFPVLVGEDDVVLSSPIILYDHPEVAPESPGNLYDSTEIDEILALRVLTLTDDEKAEARGTDPRAAAIIDRCDDMPPEIWERLHGAVRAVEPARVVPPQPAPQPQPGTPQPAPQPEPEPVVAGTGEGTGTGDVAWWDPSADASVDPWTDSVTIAGSEVRKGAVVRLRPSRRSDAQDLFLQGLTATVAGVFNDVDGSVQVAVTVDDDPATAELVWQGRYLFFHPDEVEPLGDGAQGGLG